MLGSLGYAFGLDLFAPAQVGDHVRHLQDAVMGAGGHQVLLEHEVRMALCRGLYRSPASVLRSIATCGNAGFAC